jgi:hypothetical protein
MVAHDFAQIFGSFRNFYARQNGIDHFIIQMFCFYQFEDINRGD